LPGKFSLAGLAHRFFCVCQASSHLLDWLIGSFVGGYHRFGVGQADLADWWGLFQLIDEMIFILNPSLSTGGWM